MAKSISYRIDNVILQIDNVPHSPVRVALTIWGSGKFLYLLHIHCSGFTGPLYHSHVYLNDHQLYISCYWNGASKQCFIKKGIMRRDGARWVCEADPKPHTPSRRDCGVYLLVGSGCLFLWATNKTGVGGTTGCLGISTRRLIVLLHLKLRFGHRTEDYLLSWRKECLMSWFH